MIIYGINPVLEALKTGRVREVRLDGALRDRVREIRAMADARGVPVRLVAAQELDRASRGGVHQGVAAELADAPDYSVQALVASAEGPPLIDVLDGIEVPHYVGAILRTVDAADETAIRTPPTSFHETAVALSEAMVRLARSSELRARLGAAGRARILEVYAWDRKGEQMDAIYQEAVSQAA